MLGVRCMTVPQWLHAALEFGLVGRGCRVEYWKAGGPSSIVGGRGMGSLQRRPSNSKRWELTTTTILRKITTVTTTIIPTTTSIAFTTMETNGNYRLTFKDTASEFETYYRY